MVAKKRKEDSGKVEKNDFGKDEDILRAEIPVTKKTERKKGRSECHKTIESLE